MATERQAAFFKSMYDTEAERYALLADHSRSNLTLVTFYSAFYAFSLDKLQPSTLLERGTLLAGMLALLGAFFLSLWASRIATYERVNDPIAIIRGFGETRPTDEDFFDERIVDYAVASNRNHKVNEQKANVLVLARYVLLAGILVHGAYFVLTVGGR